MNKREIKSINTNVNGLIIGQGISGKVDEVRILNIARNAAWIKTSYYSEIDDLLTYGGEENQ